MDERESEKRGWWARRPRWQKVTLGVVGALYVLGLLVGVDDGGQPQEARDGGSGANVGAPVTDAEAEARKEYLRAVASLQVAFAEKTVAAGEAMEKWNRDEATKDEVLAALDDAEAASQEVSDYLARTTPPEDFADAHDLLVQGHALYLEGLPHLRACIESDGTDSTACETGDAKVREASFKMNGGVSEYQEEAPGWPEAYAT